MSTIPEPSVNPRPLRSQAPAREPARPDGAAAAPLTILYVDDNEAARYAIAQMLRKAGFQVQEAATGRDALELIDSRPDVVVLDVNLPDMSGFEVCRRIRARPEVASIPVLHLSGTYSSSEYRVRGLEGGADGFLTKPVEPPELIATLRAMVRMRRAEEGLRESNRVLEAIIQACPLAIISLDTEARVRMWNAAAERIFGWTAAEVLGRPLPFVPADRQEESQQRIQAELRGESYHGLEIRRLKKDGSLIDLSLWTAPMRDESGAIRGLIGVLADVSERKLEAVERDRLVDERESERSRLEAVLQQMPGGVLIAEAPSGKLLFGNEQVQQILGHPVLPAESIDDYARYQAFHGDGSPFQPEEWPLVRSIRTGEVVRGDEVVYQKGDGTRTTLRARSAPIRDRDGRIVAAVMTFHDISAQKQAAAALRESEGRFKAFMDNSSSVAFMKDEQGRLVYVNRPFQRVFQRESADVIGKNDFDLFPAEIAHQLRANDAQVFEAGQPTEMIEVVPTPDGLLRHWLVIKFPIDEASGRRLLGGVAIDITERQRAEEAIRESEERFKLIARATNDAVWDRDLPTGKIWWNEGLKTIFGYSAEEITPSAVWWHDHIHPDDRERVASGLQAVVEGGGQYWSDEYRYRRTDGTFAHVFDRGYVLQDDQGRPARMIGAMMDVTERKRLEEQLRQSQKMEAIGRLAGGVAHDFNNLLTVITGYSELIMLDCSGAADPFYHKAEEIKKAADRAASLTRQLLAYSRQQVLAPKVLNLNAVVLDMEKMLRRLIGEDVELTTKLEPNLRRVTADPGQIEQVIMNLVVNARDAMPKGGRVTIETGNVELDEAYAWVHADIQPGAFVMLAVGDTGVGMTEEVRAHLFEPFFTTKEQGKGTGLGLATVYGILKQSGGHIDVETALGEGTTFKVYLPQVLETAKLEKREPPGHAAYGSETILLVEDEEMVRTLTRAILQKNGYAVLEAANGGDAIRLCEQHHGPIHLVVTDVVMPQLNGHELHQRLLRHRPNLKALFISGYTGESVAQLGVLTEGSGFLQKPFRPDALARKVRQLLDS